MRLFAKLFLIGLVVAGAAAADAAPKSAKGHYERGVKEYNLRHFVEAISEFEKAYQEDPAPVLLFNIAQSHRKLGNSEEALFFYRRYLEAAPKSENRADVEKRIADLEAIIEKAQARAQPPAKAEPIPAPPAAASNNVASRPPATPTPVALTPPERAPTPEATATAKPSAPLSGAPPGGGLRVAGAATAATGAAAVVIGILFGEAARSESASVTKALVFNNVDDAAGHRDATLQWVFYGVGTAAIVGGGILYYLGHNAEAGESRVALVPSLGASGARALTLQGRF